METYLPILKIDLSAVTQNWLSLTGGAPHGAVIKADGYGLGSVEIAKTLHQAGCIQFYTATLPEAESVAQALDDPEIRIAVFAGFAPNAAIDRRILPVLNTVSAIQMWSQMTDRGVFLQIDTGMNRFGISIADLKTLFEGGLWKKLSVQMVLSHLACSDTPEHPLNAQQRDCFAEVVTYIRQNLGTIPASLSATGGCLLGESYRFDRLRPGIGIYGGRPFTQAMPVAELYAPILQLRTISKGAFVGYGASWQAKRSSLIATVGIGYADGIQRCLSSQAQFWVGEQSCPVIGRVSMDSITIDVTGTAAKIGDLIEIFGPHQSIDEVADTAQTIGYEIFTGLGKRIIRQYKRKY